MCVDGVREVEKRYPDVVLHQTHAIHERASMVRSRPFPLP